MENLIIPKDKLPWYKDADATRIAVGVGYLVVLVSIMVFVMLTWRDVPDDAKAVILPIEGATTGNVTLKGYAAPAGNGIDITVSASAMAKDTVKNFATVLSVITSD